MGKESIRSPLREAQVSLLAHGPNFLAELRKDHLRVILTADKGVALVVVDRAEYNSKAHKLLEDRGTCKEIKTDPQIS